MSKFTGVRDDIYGVFASPSWLAEGIKTFPDNFSTKVDAPDGYIRVSIIGGGSPAFYQSYGNLSGQLVVDIFTTAGQGIARAHEIADTLDMYFVARQVGSTQFFTSTLNPYGRDSANPSLFRAIYTIPFSYWS